MVDGACCVLFLGVAVPAGHHIDVSVIMGFLLVVGFLDEELHSTTKVLCKKAILLFRYHPQIRWLKEILVKNLFLVSLVLALEYVLKLHKGMRPVKIDFLGPNFEFGDHFVDGEFDTKFPAVLMKLGLDFVTRREYGFLVSSLHHISKRFN
jgi:hypothetical protein